jgi:hypothetical protein
VTQEVASKMPKALQDELRALPGNDVRAACVPKRAVLACARWRDCLLSPPRSDVSTAALVNLSGRR